MRSRPTRQHLGCAQVIGLIVVIVLVVLVVLVGLYLVGSYNKLVSLRNRIENAWAQIDVQLRRRYDLIPNLVETVKGYATHERETLDAVITARNAGMNAQYPHDQAEAENQITGALKSIFALSAVPTSRPTRTSWPCRRS